MTIEFYENESCAECANDGNVISIDFKYRDDYYDRSAMLCRACSRGLAIELLKFL